MVIKSAVDLVIVDHRPRARVVLTCFSWFHHLDLAKNPIGLHTYGSHGCSLRAATNTNIHSYLHAFVLHREQYQLQWDLRVGAHLASQPHHHKRIVDVPRDRPNPRDGADDRVEDAEITQGPATVPAKLRGVWRQRPTAREHQIYPQKRNHPVQRDFTRHAEVPGRHAADVHRSRCRIRSDSRVSIYVRTLSPDKQLQGENPIPGNVICPR